MQLVSQLMCFAGVGVIGTIGHYVTLVTGVQFLGISPVWASFFGFIVGGVINYFLNYHLTFKSKKSHVESGIKFFTIALVGLVVNTAIMYTLCAVAEINYLISQIMATIIVLFWNFFGNRLWTFREAKSI
ncbi:MAG: GtrA family protein [Kangiella sp.]|nr:GtrA family protein [Kangiella sp.]